MRREQPLKVDLLGKLPQLVGTKEVVAMLGVKPNTLYKLLREGHFLPAYRIGGMLRWDVNELNEWVQKRRDSQKR